MSHLGESALSYIMRKSGRKPSVCNCEKCQSQCHTPCLGTPEDIMKLIEAGYGCRLASTMWVAGMIMGVTDRPVEMIQAIKEPTGFCTFFHDGKCELHDLGLKPTEGKLSHHSTKIDNFNPKKSLSWLIAKEWKNLPLGTLSVLNVLLDKIKDSRSLDAVKVRESIECGELDLKKLIR